MLAKLAELMFVEVIRNHIRGLPEDARGWFAGLRDSHVSAALRRPGGGELPTGGMCKKSCKTPPAVGLVPHRVC